MFILFSSEVLLPFILLIILLVVGSAYAVVDLFFKYWMYLAIISGILLLVRTIVTAIKCWEKWQVVVYFLAELIRIPLTYLTLVWYANDWLTQAHTNILGFIVRAGVEGIFTLYFISIAIIAPWHICIDDVLIEDVPFILPFVSIFFVMIPLGLRMFVEYYNNGVLLPIELLSRITF